MVEGGKSGVAEAAEVSVGEIEHLEVLHGGKHKGGEGVDRVVGEPQLADTSVSREAARQQCPLGRV